MTSTPMTPLFVACAFGLVAILHDLYNWMSIDWNQRNHQGNTGLHVAVAMGHEGIVRLLCERGGDVEAKNEAGCTPLHVAAWTGHGMIMQLLIENGVNTELTNERGFIALHEAARSDQELGTRILLKQEANIHTRDSYGRTALFWAIENGTQSVVNTLIEKWANIEAKDKKEQGALLGAVKAEDEAVVRALFEKRLGAHGEDSKRRRLQAARYANEAVSWPLLEPGLAVIIRTTSVIRNRFEVFAQLLQERYDSLNLAVSDEDMRKAADSQSEFKQDTCCDSCDKMISDFRPSYHCNTCNDGDFDLCAGCFNAGEPCQDSDHLFVKRLGLYEIQPIEI